MTSQRRKLTVIVAVLGCAISIGGCAQATQVEARSLSDICGDAVVASCDVYPEASLTNAEKLESLNIAVVDDATQQQIRALATDVNAFAADNPIPWGATVSQAGDAALQLDPEVSVPDRWRIAVDQRPLDEVLEEIDAARLTAGIDGVVSVDESGSWGSVSVASVAEFRQVFDELSQRDPFNDGATYRLYDLDKRLRIVHTPLWITPAIVYEVIEISERHPGAEVLLEAMEGGQSAPTLYVSKLTGDQVAALAAALTDQSLDMGRPDGINIDFVLGSTGESGVTYTTGIIGVPGSVV